LDRVKTEENRKIHFTGRRIEEYEVIRSQTKRGTVNSPYSLPRVIVYEELAETNLSHVSTATFELRKIYIPMVNFASQCY